MWNNVDVIKNNGVKNNLDSITTNNHTKIYIGQDYGYMSAPLKT